METSLVWLDLTEAEIAQPEAESDDNIVAELHWGAAPDKNELLDHNWNEFKFCDGHRLQREHHCWLFHDLYHHVLSHDWERILDIGGIWIDVHLIQQREICWRPHYDFHVFFSASMQIRFPRH